jgi:hypothetical protein
VLEFDEGHLSNNPVEAAKEIIYTLAILDDTHPYISEEENPLRHVFQSTWYRIRKVSRYSVFFLLLFIQHPTKEFSPLVCLLSSNISTLAECYIYSKHI